MNEPEIQIPRGMEHCADVFAGVYDLPIEFEKPCTIVDIGANVGAFALWACKRWPVEAIHCYEPFPSNYAVMSEAARRCFGVILPHMAGVGAKERTAIMHAGKNNCGESSMHDLGEQDMEAAPVHVRIVDAATLPIGHILKIDTEGCEVEILVRLAELNRLDTFSVVLIEYHSERDRIHIDALLSGFVLAGSYSNKIDRGVVRYLNRNQLPATHPLTMAH